MSQHHRLTNNFTGSLFKVFRHPVNTTPARKDSDVFYGAGSFRSAFSRARPKGGTNLLSSNFQKTFQMSLLPLK